MRKTIYLCVWGLLMALSGTSQTTLFDFQSTWKYLDNGSDQGSAWQNLQFNETGWKSGNGKFGYGISGTNTTISYGPDSKRKYITTYFRKVVTIADITAFNVYTGQIKRDDGAIVYINGQEVYRTNMPTGAITYKTLATAASDNGTAIQSFQIEKSHLIQGDNIIAVEVHQQKQSTDDMAFDMSLTASTDQTPPTVSSINRQNPTTQSTTATALTYRVTFSEAVSGVDALDFTATRVSGTVSGTVGAVTAVSGTNNSTYDVAVSVTGTGEVRLDLKASGTGIVDIGDNAISGGYTSGQTYIITPPPVTSQLISYGATWKYLDDGSDQGIAWRSSSFDDASWKSGPAQLGYGDGDEATVVSYGPDASNKYVTTYFRRSFNITDLNTFSSFTANIKRDDGAVVYINGQEVYRTNMPTGTVSYTTLGSSASDNGNTPQSFSISASAFVNGTNFVAVEIHQASRSSSDISFDMEISGVSTGVDQTPPTVSSINRQNPTTQSTTATALTYRVTFSETVSGVDALDFTATRVSGTVSGTVGAVTAVSGTNNSTYDVAVSVTGTGEVRLDLKASGTGIVDGTGNAISGGYTSGQTYIIGTTDQTPPTVSSINRQNPTTQSTTATALTYRVTFSETVSGVDALDFTATRVSGTVSGTVGAVTAVSGTNNSTYDVAVSVTGTGEVRLDLKASGTGIVDGTGNAISGGYTSGQTYIIGPPTSTLSGFSSVTYLSSIDVSSHTGQKPQAKTWYYANKWWAVLATSSGTKIFRLDGTAWTDILTVATSTNSKCDVRVVGNLVHMLLFRGASSNSYIVSVEYDASTGKYKLWSQRSSRTTVIFEDGAETATIDIDNNGRMWIASDGLDDIRVRWSDPPFTTVSDPIILESNVTTDDICAITALPNEGKVAVFWSNQNTHYFGFKTHTDGTSPAVWSNDEVPSSQSALNVGAGFSDDHMNLMVGSDGTLYCAVKTSYDTPGYPKVSLLVRRPTGTWDDVYPVTTDMVGTRPIVVLNESVGKLKVLYSSLEGGGDILYKEAALSNLTNFSREFTLLSGNYNYLSSTHQRYDPDVAVIVTDQSSTTLKVAGFLGSDAPATTTKAAVPPQSDQKLISTINTESSKGKQLSRIIAFPTSFSQKATLRYELSEGGAYTIKLYNISGAQVAMIKHGWAEPNKQYTTEVNGASLANGVYLVRLQTNKESKTVKLLLNR